MTALVIACLKDQPWVNCCLSAYCRFPEADDGFNSLYLKIVFMTFGGV